MPTFLDFSYYFTIKVLGISKLLVGIGGIYMGLAIMSIPPIYNRYLMNSEYKSIFVGMQILTLFSTLICTLQAMRLNTLVGIPDSLLYVISSQFAEVIERALTMFPSKIIMARIIAPGVEGTMMSFASIIINLNQFTIRNLIGVFINNTFVHVSNDTMNDYYILCWIRFGTSFIPLTYMWWLLPTNAEVAALEQKHKLNFSEEKEEK